jgi:prepilin-type N-terminal cleavage/methylation domain-containing protein
MIKLNKLKKKKGFTLVELLVVVAILAILSVALLPSVLGYSDKARDARAIKDVRNFATVIDAFAATDGDYPEASLDTDNPRSIASVMQSKGIKWTGDETGVIDPWDNPYYYDLTEDYYCIGSAGKDGTLNTADDICNIGSKVSKKASGLDGNAIPSAVPDNNPGGGGPEHQAEVPDGYIGIYTAEQLASIGVSEGYPLDSKYILMNNISLSEYIGWLRIGNAMTPFAGIFDGNNCTISDLTVNASIAGEGLFGYVSETAKIIDLGLENINVTGGIYTGGLVGNSYGTIENCYVAGSVTGGNCTGGLAGYSAGSITNCYAVGNVTGGQDTGGLVGDNTGSITNCYAAGNIEGTANRTGGLVGNNNENASIVDSYALADVNSIAQNTGGLVGDNTGSITNCYAAGNIEGTANRTGGLVGNNSGPIANSYATGTVKSSANYVGGLVGDNSSSIVDCYATGNIESNARRIGGLAGANNGTVTNCYAVGNVTGDSNTGGLVGQNSGTITDCYYDTETTGQSDDDGRGTPLTTAEMKNSANFTDWDFIITWSIEENNSYPFLLDNEQIPHPGI